MVPTWRVKYKRDKVFRWQSSFEGETKRYNELIDRYNTLRVRRAAYPSQYSENDIANLLESLNEIKGFLQTLQKEAEKAGFQVELHLEEPGSFEKDLELGVRLEDVMAPDVVLEEVLPDGELLNGAEYNQGVPSCGRRKIAGIGLDYYDEIEYPSASDLYKELWAEQDSRADYWRAMKDF